MSSLIHRVRGLGIRPGRARSVRLRSTLVAVVAVGLALLIGGSGLVALLQNTLDQNARDSGRARADEVVALIEADGVTEAAESLPEESRSGQYVQIVRSDRTVVGSSNKLVASRPLTRDQPPVGRFAASEPEHLGYLGERGEWMVVATTVESAGAIYQIYVAVSIEVLRTTVQTVATALLVGMPVLLAAVAFAVWRLVGRALSSVEGIRQAVAAIDARRLADRVEVPPTGDEIAALATTMNGMLDRLQASHRGQRAFVSDASHELRSPLATLSTAAELAESGDEATRTRLLSTINLELGRMRGLVENLMTLARADSEDLAGSPADVDLDDLVGDEARRLSATSSRDVRVHIQPTRVWGDRHRLAQALRNLVDNAERHAASTVRLTLSSDDDGARLWVDNDGPVIDSDQRERIFERFVRLDESRSRDVGGSGLGLSITRVAVQAYGGDVAVVDAPDGWCRFEIRMPTGDPSSSTGRSI